MNINRILIVGLGSVGTRHLKYLRSMFPKVDIRALTSKSLNKIKYDLNGILNDIDEAIKTNQILLIVLNTNHIEVSKNLLYKIHLFVENYI